jgi:hypothetical protein
MDSHGPKEMVNRFFSFEYKKLGRKTIKDIVVEGIEVSDPGVVLANFPIDNMTARLWVNVETNLPVLLESEFTAQDGMVQFKTVMDQFQWNVELEKSFFVPDIPADFTKLNDQGQLVDKEKQEAPKENIINQKVLSESEQKEKAIVKDMASDIFQACANENLETLFEFLPHEIIKTQPEHYEYLSDLEIIKIKEPYQQKGSSKWVVPYKVNLRSGSVREGNLYIAYYKKSQRYIITGGLRE